jgi:hypothetical protein
VLVRHWVNRALTHLSVCLRTDEALKASPDRAALASARRPVFREFRGKNRKDLGAASPTRAVQPAKAKASGSAPPSAVRNRRWMARVIHPGRACSAARLSRAFTKIRRLIGPKIGSNRRIKCSVAFLH